MSDEDFLLDDSEDDTRLDDEGADDLSAPAARKRRSQKIRFREKQVQEFYQRVFADPVGRAVMWEILQACHFRETKFACGPNGFPQPEATWFHAGEQAVGDRLFNTWRRHDRDGVLLMEDEHDPQFARIRK